MTTAETVRWPAGVRTLWRKPVGDSRVLVIGGGAIGNGIESVYDDCRLGRTAPALVDSGTGAVQARVCGLVDCLVFDGCEAAEPSLASSAVVGAFDPGDDRQAQLFPR